jgi:hypothetical protein
MFSPGPRRRFSLASLERHAATRWAIALLVGFVPVELSGSACAIVWNAASRIAIRTMLYDPPYQGIVEVLSYGWSGPIIESTVKAFPLSSLRMVAGVAQEATIAKITEHGVPI